MMDREKWKEWISNWKCKDCIHYDKRTGKCKRNGQYVKPTRTRKIVECTAYRRVGDE